MKLITRLVLTGVALAAWGIVSSRLLVWLFTG
jgi:hypothetical protein